MKQQDPVALAVVGAALALLSGLLLYVLVFKAPEPAVPARAARPGLAEEVRRFVAALAEKIRDQAATRAPRQPALRAPDKPVDVAPAAPKAGSPAKVVPPAPASGPGLEAGRVWRYAVTVEPPIWRDITLTYRTQREGGSIGVLTDFLHAGGKMNFHLGIFAPNHPSHENTRFPGFFMYAAYLKQPLTIGQPIAFAWHWQGKSAASVKRFEGRVMGWEDVQLPGGNLKAAKIEGTLTYREDGQFRGGAHETFWYAPKVSQIVKIVRDGITPDEGSRRIVAELAEFR